jgi:hypothetical protein
VTQQLHFAQRALRLHQVGKGCNQAHTKQHATQTGGIPTQLRNEVVYTQHIAGTRLLRVLDPRLSGRHVECNAR